MDGSNTPKANRLLAALPAAAYRRLLPKLDEVTLHSEERLFAATGPLHFAYFPTSSIVTSSYAADANGSRAKAWSIGCEGMVGISLFLRSPTRDNRDKQADVQLGGLAFRISAPALRAEFRRAGALQHLLLRYVFALVTQVSQLSVCTQYHTLEQRLCHFLLRAFDRVNDDKVFVTQVRMGELLGVRRESITEIAWRLQEAGIIRYSRGHMTLMSREKLEDRACPCGGIIRRAFEAVSI
jgi:Crp-like helix-turn-helix domain